MKKHNTMKLILGCILLCAILTWIIPAAYYQSEFVDQGVMQMGLFDLFSYSLTSLSYFGYIGLYMIVVGGFYGILYKIPAYRNMLDKTAEKMKKHGMVYISIISILLAVLTSICGLQLGLILFFPLIASLILLMGYDKIVVALTLVGSTMIGIIGSTYAYGNVSVLNSYLGTSLDENIAVKIAILVVGLLILILNTVFYSKKFKTATVKTNKVIAEEVEKQVQEEVKVVEVKKSSNSGDKDKEKKSSSKTTSKSTGKKSTTKSAKSTEKKSTTTKKSTSKSKNNNKAAALDDEVITVKNTSSEFEDYLVPAESTTKGKSWPLVIGLLILFVVLVLAFIPWNGAFQLDIMSKATEAVNNYKLFDFPIFAKLLGTYNTFGDWMITDMLFPMAFITLLLVIIYRVKLNDVLEGFAEGAKKALGPAAIVLLVYTILVINTYHPFQLTIYKAILGKGKTLNVITSSVAGALSGMLNVDPSYAFQAVIPYLAGTITNSDVYPIIAVIYTAMYGFIMLIAPTSVVLMGTLSYLGVSYKEWFKAVWKLLIELLIVLLVIFTLLVVL